VGSNLKHGRLQPTGLRTPFGRANLFSLCQSILPINYSPQTWITESNSTMEFKDYDSVNN